MKDKQLTLSDIGIQKSTLRNIHNTGEEGEGGISSCAVLLHSVTKTSKA